MVEKKEDSLEKQGLDLLIRNTIIDLGEFKKKFHTFKLDNFSFNKWDGKPIEYFEFCQNIENILNVLLERPFVYYSMSEMNKQNIKVLIQDTQNELKDIINGSFTRNAAPVTDQARIIQFRFEACKNIISLYYTLQDIVHPRLMDDNIRRYEAEQKIEKNSQKLFKEFRTTSITITRKQIFMLIGVLWALWWYIPDVFLIKWEVYKINTLIPIWTITIGLVVWIWPFEKSNNPINAKIEIIFPTQRAEAIAWLLSAGLILGTSFSLVFWHSEAKFQDLDDFLKLSETELLKFLLFKISLLFIPVTAAYFCLSRYRELITLTRHYRDLEMHAGNFNHFLKIIEENHPDSKDLFVQKFTERFFQDNISPDRNKNTFEALSTGIKKIKAPIQDLKDIFYKEGKNKKEDL